MEVPHFHHDLVYEALVAKKTEEVMCKLLHSLLSSFHRVYDKMVDICSDVPKTNLTLHWRGWKLKVITTGFWCWSAFWSSETG